MSTYIFIAHAHAENKIFSRRTTSRNSKIFRCQDKIRETCANSDIYLFSLRACAETRRINQFFAWQRVGRKVALTMQTGVSRKLENATTLFLYLTFLYHLINNVFFFFRNTYNFVRSLFSFNIYVKANRIAFLNTHWYFHFITTIVTNKRDTSSVLSVIRHSALRDRETKQIYPPIRRRISRLHNINV